MTHIRLLASFLTLAVLGGCAGAGQDIENLRMAEAKGDAFTQKLVAEYRQITLFEADQMKDWRDAGRFARKGLRAADGEVVVPEAIADWELPSEHVGELTAARRILLELLDASARTKFPVLGGHAQGRFDCWIEQQEENHQPDHIAACRKQFNNAIKGLTALMTPAPEPEPMAEPAPPTPMAMTPETFIVYFAFDSIELTSESNSVLDDAMRAAF